MCATVIVIALRECLNVSRAILSAWPAKSSYRNEEGFLLVTVVTAGDRTKAKIVFVHYTTRCTTRCTMGCEV